MNNRKRMIERVYRQNRGLCSNSDLIAIINSFYQGFLDEIKKATQAIRNIGTAALEVAKSFEEMGR